jgi:hypothetical protein
MRWINQSEFKVMPWRNGLGVTSEIEICPLGSDFSRNPFLWRLSAAHVTAPNQFSQFPGFDRLLTIIDGEGLLLNGKPLYKGQVLSFSGEDTIQCELLDQAVEDLGLIYNRDHVQAAMTVIRLQEALDLQAKSEVEFMKVLSGEMKIEGQVFNSSGILRLEKNERIQLEPQKTDTDLIRIQMTSTAESSEEPRVRLHP